MACAGRLAHHGLRALTRAVFAHAAERARVTVVARRRVRGCLAARSATVVVDEVAVVAAFARVDVVVAAAGFELAVGRTTVARADVAVVALLVGVLDQVAAGR